MTQENSNTVCLYHGTDLDGYFSAAIVAKFVPGTELIAYNYGVKTPNIKNKEKVFIVDVSVPINNLIKLCDNNEQVIWIDHHASSIKTFLNYKKKNKIPENLVAHLAKYLYSETRDNISVDQMAGCELAWEYFSVMPMPDIVRIVGEYDTFRHIGRTHEKPVLFVQLGLRIKVNSPAGAIDAMMLEESSPNSVLQAAQFDGRIIYANERRKVKHAYENSELIFMFHDNRLIEHRFKMVNLPEANPKNYDYDYDDQGFSGAGSFNIYYNSSKKKVMCRVTIYSDSVSCSEIAAKYGGGGHIGAAGFEIPFSMFFSLLSSL